MYFDDRSYRLTYLAVARLGRLYKTGSEFDDQLTTSVVGEDDNENPWRKRIGKEQLMQIICVTT